MMNDIIFAIIAVSVIGVICAAVLVIASKIMSVKENEKIPVIRECLPGANCGACGFAGCDGYAKALAENETSKTNLCVPGGDTVSRKLSEIMGVEFEDVAKKVAVVHCSGDCKSTQDKVDYEGISGCSAAKLIFGSKGECSFGCIGLGDCMAVCQNNAICLDDGVARVNSKLCVGCGLCVKECPNHLITLMDDVDRVIVSCSNRDKGAVTRKVCSNGCIGCKKCERVCKNNAIKVIDNLAVIDCSKCADCDDFGICARECTTGCIVLSDFDGVHRIKQ